QRAIGDTAGVGAVDHVGDLARRGDPEPRGGPGARPECEGAAGGGRAVGDDDEAGPAVHLPVAQRAAGAVEELRPGAQDGLAGEPPLPAHPACTRLWEVSSTYSRCSSTALAVSHTRDR